MDYETFGEHQKRESGIFEFLRTFPGEVLNQSKFRFMTLAEAAKKLQPVAAYNVPYPISWADEERDLTAWLGNEMQQEAFSKLYDLTNIVKRTTNPDILRDWKYLQASDHFYYISTKFFSDGAVHSYFNPYTSPYDAFINYMNVISDFHDRLKQLLPENLNEIEKPEPEKKTDELSENEKRILIQQYEQKIAELKKQVQLNMKIDGRMTVGSLKKNFKKIFGLNISVYSGKTAGKGAKKVDNNIRFSKFAVKSKNPKVFGIFEINDEMTIEEFENEFLERYNIAVQVSDPNEKKLLKNTMKLNEVVKDKK